MLTDSDIKKLKKIFATKEDLKKFATKDDLKKFATKEDLKAFATKEDLKKFATKEDLRKGLTEMTDEIVREMTEVIGDLVTRIDNALEEIRSHRIVLGDHEERIEKIEENLFTSSTP
jgi:DNA invertase Pin-like site-specific DNA recombinase